MPNIGPLELVVILVVVLLLFGAKRLPELGKSLGSGMREFKDSVTGDDKTPHELTVATDMSAYETRETETQQAS